MTAQSETRLKPQHASGTVDASIPQRIAPAPKCLDLIAEVHTRVLDSIAGFEKVVEKAQPDFQPIAKAFLAMHLRHETELANALITSNRDPSADGSVFGTVNRAAVEIKSWFEDVTDKIMDQVKFAELHILDAYNDAQSACQSTEIQSLITAHIKDIDALMSKHIVSAKG
jgi:hypothetical protein